MTDEHSPLKIDKVALAAESLGKGKTAAEDVATRLSSVFEGISTDISKLAQEGITVSNVHFDIPILQAAWERYSRPDRDPDSPPEMLTEDEIVARIR